MVGLLLIDKPPAWTSHDVVGYLRKVTGVKKIGHAGTLDPFATGLLLVGVGREATKRLDEFKNLPKTYLATLVLGAVSTTGDSDGVIEESGTSTAGMSEKILCDCLDSFKGRQMQTPPMHSAKKVGGQKLYQLARKGIEIERKEVEIEVFDIRFISFTSTPLPEAVFEVTVSPGTYIRTLCEDIGKKLEVGGYCKALRRTAIGSFRVEESHDPKSLSRETIKLTKI